MSSPSFLQKILTMALTAIAIFVATLPAFAEVYLSKGDGKGFPTKQSATTFHCNDKIFGIASGKWPANSEHLLEAYWTDPQGKQREHTRYKFIAGKDQTQTWAWLLLHPAEPDILERLMMQGNDSMLEFNGEWKVNFFVDGQSIGKLTFRVICE